MRGNGDIRVMPFFAPFKARRASKIKVSGAAVCGAEDTNPPVGGEASHIDNYIE